MLVVGTFASRRLLPLLGLVRLLITGSLCTAAGLAWLAWLPARPDYLGHILGPTLIAGIGMSLVVLPVTVLATSGVNPTEAGLASGLLNMGRQIGGALGLAILVTIATTVAAHSHRYSPAAASVHGYHVALLVAAALSLATAASTLLLRRPTGRSGSRSTAGAATTAATERTATEHGRGD
jgi:MFS family permease